MVRWHCGWAFRLFPILPRGGDLTSRQVPLCPGRAGSSSRTALFSGSGRSARRVEFLPQHLKRGLNAPGTIGDTRIAQPHLDA